MSLALSPNQDEETLKAGVIACAVITVVFAAMVVGLRFYTRWKIIRALGAEDWLILAALTWSLGSSIETGIQVNWALGKHIGTVTSDELSNFQQASWFTTVFYNLTLTFTKTSILALYIRVLRAHETFRRLTWCLLAIIVMFSVAVLVMLLTACIPLNKYWDPEVNGYCHPVNAWWAITGFNIGSDILIFFMPMPVIVRMKLPIRQKAGLVVIFALGFLVCLISILRVAWLQNLASSDDFTFDHAPIAAWSCVEINTAIVCASLVTLKPLLHKFVPSSQSRMMLDGEPGEYERPATLGGLRIRPVPGGIDSDMQWSPRPGTVEWSSRSGTPFSDRNTASSDDFVRLAALQARENGRFRCASPTLSPTLPPKSFLTSVKEVEETGHKSRLTRASVLSGTSQKSSMSFKVW